MTRPSTRWAEGPRRQVGSDSAIQLAVHQFAFLTGWSAGGRIGIGGIDTRRLTPRDSATGRTACRAGHMTRPGEFDVEALVASARKFPGLEGLDLGQEGDLRAKLSLVGDPVGPGRTGTAGRKLRSIRSSPSTTEPNATSSAALPRSDVTSRCCCRQPPPQMTCWRLIPRDCFSRTVRATRPATGDYAVPMIQDILARSNMPVFGICLGHQMLALALGARTVKMNHGHHGANHPVKDLETGKVEITSMNHGFHRGRPNPAGWREGNPCLPVRRIELRHPDDGPSRVFGPVPPRGKPGPG